MTQQEIDAIENEEAARWQERIERTIRSHGLAPCDPSGNESGDPLDWTDDQVSRALSDARAQGILEFVRAILHGDERHRAWLLRAFEVFAQDGQLSPALIDELGSTETARLRDALDSTGSFLAGLFLSMDEKDARRDKVCEAAQRIDTALGERGGK